MLVAVWDQKEGTSTLSCSKTSSPFSFPMLAVRRSQEIASNGWCPSSVKKREKMSPFFPWGLGLRADSDEAAEGSGVPAAS